MFGGCIMRQERLTLCKHMAGADPGGGGDPTLKLEKIRFFGVKS